jgi:hypothetical protein
MTRTIESLRDFSTIVPSSPPVRPRSDQPNEIVNCDTTHTKVSFTRGDITPVEVMDERFCEFIDLDHNIRFIVPDQQATTFFRYLP